MNTYRIPREGRAQQAYFDYVGTLPWVFTGDPQFNVDPSGETVTVDGTIAGFELLAQLPPPPSVQDAMWQLIKAERDRRKLNGVFVSGKWLDTDTFSRIQWIGMVMMGASIPAVQWKTKDGTFITTSQALAAAVFSATAVLDATVFVVAENHRLAMLASPDPASYDWSRGWPATFV